MHRVLVLCLFGLSVSLLIENVRALEGEGIIGGDDAELGDYPYQISLQVSGRSICGGSILNERFVITAAHCVSDKRANFYRYPMQVVAGINDLNYDESTRVAVDVEQVYIPKEYYPANFMSRTTGDIAVLKLSKPLDIDSNPNLAKVELADPKKTYAGEKAVISGFGWNYVDVVFNPKTGGPEETNGGGFGMMRYAEVDILSNAECQEKTWSIAKPHICGTVVQHKGRRPQGVCSGDSGGPLVHGNNTLIGVVSTSPLGCRENKEPAVYTRISSYVDFVNNVVEGISNAETRTIKLRIFG